MPTVKNVSSGINYTTKSDGSVSVYKDSSGTISREVDLENVSLIDKIISSSTGGYTGKVYYQTSVDGVNWSQSSAYPRYLPAGRYVRIINEVDGKSDVILQPPLIQTTNPENITLVQEQILDTKIAP